MIETLTYSYQNIDTLTAVNSELQNIYDTMKNDLPQAQGLVIRPLIAQQAKMISKKYKNRSKLLNQRYSSLQVGKKRSRHKQCASIT